jgi:hypothetical protein
MKLTPKVEMEPILSLSDNMNEPSSGGGDLSGEELAEGTIIVLLMQNDESGNLVCKEADHPTSLSASPAANGTGF